MNHLSISPKGLAISLALISAICMFLLSLIGLAGYFQETVTMMQAMHLGYDLTTVGIIVGMIEAAVVSFVGGWLIAVFHNKFA